MRTGFTMLLAMLLLATPTVRAQQGFLVDDKEARLMKVKQIEEFMVRFNRQAMPVVMDSATAHRDMKMIALLFDMELLERRGPDALEFIQAMIADSVALHFADTNWYADALCLATVGGREVELTLRLRVEDEGNGCHKWVIAGAWGEPLQLRPQRKSASRKISPTDNELAFMQLADITGSDAENVLNYANRGYRADQTSVFFALVAAGVLKVVQVSDLVYHFHTRGYDFEVRYFQRNGANSGWLVSSFEKLSE